MALQTASRQWNVAFGASQLQCNAPGSAPGAHTAPHPSFTRCFNSCLLFRVMAVVRGAPSGAPGSLIPGLLTRVQLPPLMGINSYISALESTLLPNYPLPHCAQYSGRFQQPNPRSTGALIRACYFVSWRLYAGRLRVRRDLEPGLSTRVQLPPFRGIKGIRISSSAPALESTRQPR